MSSLIERTFCRLLVFHGEPALESFFNYLSIDDLLNLRLASNSLSNNTTLARVAFKTIYVHTPPPPAREQLFHALESIVEHCQHLYIKIAFPYGAPSPWEIISFDSNPVDLPSSKISRTPGGLYFYAPYKEPPIAWKFFLQKKPSKVDEDLLNQWLRIFALFPRMQTLTIACNGDPAWPGCTDIEALLIILRISLERTNPKSLHTVRLCPIHAMGIMHLRWAGAGTYGEAPASRDIVWQRLRILELQIINPFVQGRLSDSQRRVFVKVLHDYLQSFRRTLTRLNISWIGADGPDPFNLVSVVEASTSNNHWQLLEELWLGNVVLREGLRTTITTRAPSLKKLKISIRGAGAGDLAADENLEVSWLDLLSSEGQCIEGKEGTGGLENTAVAMPIYPRSEQSGGGRSETRLIPVELELKARAEETAVVS